MARKEEIFQVAWAGVSDNEPINFDKLIVTILKVIQRWFIVSVRNQFCRNAFTAPAGNVMRLRS